MIETDYEKCVSALHSGNGVDFVPVLYSEEVERIYDRFGGDDNPDPLPDGYETADFYGIQPEIVDKILMESMNTGFFPYTDDITGQTEPEKDEDDTIIVNTEHWEYTFGGFTTYLELSDILTDKQPEAVRIFRNEYCMMKRK